MSIGVNYEYRAGIGTDIHRLTAGRKLVLGGVEIPFGAGLMGHSDGDAAIHSIIDALLGAAGMGDIGGLFPDTDPQYKNADSRSLLVNVRDKLKKSRWEVVNVDLIIHAEQPRLESYKGQIKRTIADLLDVDFNAVNIKAKTSEGLGETGSGEAIAATATAMLKRRIRGLL